MAFKMKGFSGFGKGTKRNPIKLRPSYKHTEEFNTDTGEWESKKIMISDRERKQIEKAQKEGNYEGEALWTSTTGMTKAKEGIEGHKKEGGYPAEASNIAPISGEKGAKSAKEHKEDIEEGITESATDTEVIAEEKKQAQLFPHDVKRAQRAINVEAAKMNLPVGSETKKRGAEATTVIEKKKKESE